jgi:single-stranded-DNA-specific exonuclease
MERKWEVASKIDDEIKARFPEIAPTVLQLLWNRGLRTQAAIDEFLNPDYGRDLHDPFLFRDMSKACERLGRACREREKIAVHGDYDADGVCAAAIAVTTLRALGAEAGVFLPHREIDGYGLNRRTVERLAAEGVKVIVTCDCGIANAAEVALAREKGMDVIITDHHALPAELPGAFATIHPQVPGETYPRDGLAGGGVAWKLAQALVRRAARGGVALPPGFEKWLLDLVAISSVADLVPLLGETRTLVKYGLVVLGKTRRVGLRELMLAAGVYAEDGRPRRAIDSATIGFQIAPRLNAAGRLDHANAAF